MADTEFKTTGLSQAELDRVLGEMNVQPHLNEYKTWAQENSGYDGTSGATLTPWLTTVQNPDGTYTRYAVSGNDLVAQGTGSSLSDLDTGWSGVLKEVAPPILAAVGGYYGAQALGGMLGSGGVTGAASGAASGGMTQAEMLGAMSDFGTGAVGEAAGAAGTTAAAAGGSSGVPFMSDKALADLAAMESGKYGVPLTDVAGVAAGVDPMATTALTNAGWSGELLGYTPAQIQAAIEGKASWSTVGLGSGLTGGKSITDLVGDAKGAVKSGGAGATGAGGGSSITNVVSKGDNNSLLAAMMALAGKQQSAPDAGSISAAAREADRAASLGRN
jgi:hypothetical protein